MTNIYIVKYTIDGGIREFVETGIGAVYFDLDEAKAEVDRLEAANSWTSASILTRIARAPRAWTPEQKRWLGL